MVDPRITGAIIARDEARHLGACLNALAWTDEQLVVLDARTRDASALIARARGARVVVHEFTTFPAQRNAALDRVATPWVLFVDADERATPALAGEVRRVIANGAPAAPVGYWVPRRNFIWKGWIRHGGWSPDYQLRLLKVAAAHYDEDRDVHELARLGGEAGHLREPLIHFNYDRIDQFFLKQRAYARLEAQRLARQGTRARPHNFVLQPLRELRRRLIDQAGYRDGWRGFALAGLLAGYTALTYAELTRATRRQEC